MAEILLDSVSFTYPGSQDSVLSDLSLHVQNGEAHALLGASGAGKTTLLNLLSGLLTPTSGRVVFDGVDVSDRPGHLRNVAQVFQFPVLYEAMTVARNLALPLENRGLERDLIERRVAQIAAELGIESCLERKPRALSLFEKQLAAVGKALARPDVSVVLLDEPLTAVEPKIKWRLRQVLRNAQADLGVTMIYVTHDQTEALTFADRVSVLTPDGIAQTGTPEAVYEAPEHQFVGHFVGSPGMNFVPSRLLGLERGDTVGFRPEWAGLHAGDGPLRGTVARVRHLGTRRGLPQVMATVRTPVGDINVRGADEVTTGAAVAVQVRRYVLFADQCRVENGEF